MYLKDQKLLAEAYVQIYESTEQGYYDDLSLFLAKHYPRPTLKIGTNLINPDLGYVDPKQKGIFDQDTGKQIGKLEVSITDGVITLENIKAFKQPGPEAREDDEDIVEQKSYGLGEKVLKHLKGYALKNNLDVAIEAVNPALRMKFERIFSDWHLVSREGDYLRVTHRE